MKIVCSRIPGKGVVTNKEAAEEEESTSMGDSKTDAMYNREQE
jgi:hypothetical protein